MDADQPNSIDQQQIRRRLQELDREVKTLFRTMPAGPELVSRWGTLIREARLLEDQVSPEAKRKPMARNRATAGRGASTKRYR
jgi:hypothetical protein